MWTLILIIAIIAITLLILSTSPRGGYRLNVNRGTFSRRGISFTVIGITLLVILGIILLRSLVIIPPGRVGVQIFLGKVLDNVLTEGPHIVLPIIQVVTMDVRTRAYTMGKATPEIRVAGIISDAPIKVLSSDGLNITLDVTVLYHLDPQAAPKVYKKLGIYYEYKVIKPAVREALRTAAVKYKATDLYSSKREEFVAIATERIEKLLSNEGIILEKVLLRNVDLPETVKKAIEEKIAALQEAQRMKYVLEKEKLEAKRKEVEAQGLANAQRIINQTLTSKYLQYLYLTTLRELANSQNTTFIITPFDRSLVPLINLNPNTEKKR